MDWYSGPYLPETIAYISGAYVPPDHRGHALVKRGLVLIKSTLLENTNITGVFFITAPDNVSMNKTVNPLDIVHCYSFIFIRVMGFKFYLLSSIEDRCITTVDW